LNLSDISISLKPDYEKEACGRKPQDRQAVLAKDLVKGARQEASRRLGAHNKQLYKRHKESHYGSGKP
jgi:hypothetical protein